MTALFALLAAALATVALLAVRLRELRASLAARDVDLRDQGEARAALKAQLEAERRAAAERELLVAQSIDALSRRALQANNEQFLELAKESLGTFAEKAKGDLELRQQAIGDMVRPVRETLEKVEGKIHQFDTARAVLSQQVTSLASETGNLAKALRTPAVRGKWGEIQLRRVVELAGMVANCDFVEQHTFQGDEGKLRPDVIVKLPGNKRLVVDAKAPLAAYLDALEARDEASRKAHLVAHARQLRNHVQQLSRKAYWDQLEQTPEFVVLFVPNEAVFAAAMEQDPELLEGAVADNVLLASPTTLIALLRAAAFGWRQEKLAEDAQAIASLGRELHKRLGRLATHFEKLGRGVATVVTAYNETVGSFERMVVPGARKLREKAAPMDEELTPLPDVDAAPRALQPPEEVNVPDDAN